MGILRLLCAAFGSSTAVEGGLGMFLGFSAGSLSSRKKKDLNLATKFLNKEAFSLMRSSLLNYSNIQKKYSIVPNDKLRKCPTTVQPLPLPLFPLNFFAYISFDEGNGRRVAMKNRLASHRVFWSSTRLFVFIMCICRQAVFGQHPLVSEPEQQPTNKFEFEKSAFEQRQTESAASSWFDVTYYGLNLDLSTNPGYLKGDVNIIGICRQDNSQSLTLDLMNTMHIDSVQVNGQGCPFMQMSSSFDITLDHSYQSGEILSTDVFYEGVPVPTGFGSFEFDSHAGVPWVYSLSEPYGARDWWPCKNTQSDKADSADITVTCDSTYKVGSEGVLVSVVN